MTTTTDLDDRYGRTRRPGVRRAWAIGLGTVAVAAVAVFGWITVTNSMRSVGAEALGFQVEGEHSVTLKFQFSPPAGRDVACAIEALDPEFGVVGYRVIGYPAVDSHQQVVVEQIKTVARATTAVVQGCWVS